MASFKIPMTPLEVAIAAFMAITSKLKVISEVLENTYLKPKTAIKRPKNPDFERFSES